MARTMFRNVAARPKLAGDDGLRQPEVNHASRQFSDAAAAVVLPNTEGSSDASRALDRIGTGQPPQSPETPITEVELGSAEIVPTDSLYASQWHLNRLGGLETIWDEYTGDGVNVGVFDNGVQYWHPDLNDNYDSSLHVVIDGSVIDGAPYYLGSDFHGTAVAGLIAAENNGTGAVGVAFDALLTSVPVLGYNPYTAETFAAYELAFNQWAAFDVANNSFGRTADFTVGTYVGIELAAAGLAVSTGRSGLGTILVKSAGNSSQNSNTEALDASRFTVVVGAYDSDGDVSSYSDHGANLHVSAPSSGSSLDGDLGQVTTDLLGRAGYTTGDYTAGFGGTSGAAPLVSGVAALMLEANPNLGWRDVQDILAYSATYLAAAAGSASKPFENGTWQTNGARNWNGGGLHFSVDYGYGALNAFAAVRMAEVWSLFQPAQTSANENSFTLNLGTAAIPDAGSLVLSATDASPGEFDLEYVEVTVNITHADLTQLEIALTGPNGAKVILASGDGTVSTATSGWTWTFGANAFRGQSTEGTWTVTVTDLTAGSTGTVNSVDLKFYGRDGLVAGQALVNDVYHYTDEIIWALGQDASRLNLSDADGGSDWLDLAAMTGNLVVNLTAGTASVDATNFIQIAAGTVIENVVAGDGDDTLVGNSAANVLRGMRGDDIYEVSTGDKVFEAAGAGIDLVKSFVNFNLAALVNGAAQFVDNLTLLGTALSATGNSLSNVLTGNGRGNALHGDTSATTAEADTMQGLGGNDTYFVDHLGDRVLEATSTAGIDTVNSSVNFSLAALVNGRAQFADNVTLTGSALTATGNALANTLVGNGLGNTLNGGGGTDTLRGGAGRDLMTGGLQSDTFDFDSLTDSTRSLATADFLQDFSLSTTVGDKIDLNTLDANTTLTGNQDFSTTVLNKTIFSATAANFTAIGQILAFTSGVPAGSDVVIALNTDANFVTAEMFIALNLVDNTTQVLSAAYFVV